MLALGYTIIGMRDENTVSRKICVGPGAYRFSIRKYVESVTEILIASVSVFGSSNGPKTTSPHSLAFCVFRVIPSTHSGVNRPPIPIHSVH
jgi:hypothetical protein